MNRTLEAITLASTTEPLKDVRFFRPRGDPRYEGRLSSEVRRRGEFISLWISTYSLTHLLDMIRHVGP